MVQLSRRPASRERPGQRPKRLRRAPRLSSPRPGPQPNLQPSPSPSRQPLWTAAVRSDACRTRSLPRSKIARSGRSSDPVDDVMIALIDLPNLTNSRQEDGDLAD